jgi:hypothetical protein
MRLRLTALAALVCLGCADCGGAGTSRQSGGEGDSGGGAAAADATAGTCSPANPLVEDASVDAATLLGASCVPAAEQSSQFGGFSPQEVSIESNAPGCGGGACIVNHFQGRATCPGGQSAEAVDGAAACLTAGTCDAVTVPVQPQCTDRPATQTVYCSCRCANVDGRTDDGATYCTCPSTMTCVQLVESIGADAGPPAGAYCLKMGTEYDQDAEAACH